MRIDQKRVRLDQIEISSQQVLAVRCGCSESSAAETDMALIDIEEIRHSVKMLVKDPAQKPVAGI